MSNIPARIAGKIEKQPNGCWLWTGCLNHKGYGKTINAGKYWQAHRFVYTLLVGEIPEGLQLDHFKCYNHACVNPEHLRPATNAENGVNREGLNSNNRTGYRGVTAYRDGRYRARFKGQFLGYYVTVEAANEAVQKARELTLSA